VDPESGKSGCGEVGRQESGDPVERFNNGWGSLIAVRDNVVQWYPSL
jgi:hypothetical protein